MGAIQLVEKAKTSLKL